MSQASYRFALHEFGRSGTSQARHTCQMLARVNVSEVSGFSCAPRQSDQRTTEALPCLAMMCHCTGTCRLTGTTASFEGMLRKRLT